MERQVTIVLDALHVKQVFRHDYLVEEVPTAIIRQRALPLGTQHIPPRIVEIAISYVLHLPACSKFLCQRNIVGIIVHITHDNDALLGICLSNAIGKVAHLLTRNLTEIACGSTTWPVANNDCQCVAIKFALHRQISTGGTRSVSVLVDVRLEEPLFRFEHSRIV